LVAESKTIHARLDTLLEHFTVTACVSRKRRDPISCPWLVDAVRAAAAKSKSALSGRLVKDASGISEAANGFGRRPAAMTGPAAVGNTLGNRGVETEARPLPLFLISTNSGMTKKGFQQPANSISGGCGSPTIAVQAIWRPHPVQPKREKH